MSNTHFVSSSDFDTFTIAVTKNLKKCKLSELRHAIAKAEHFTDVRPFKDSLDQPCATGKLDTNFVREFTDLAFSEAVEIAYSYFDFYPLCNFPSEGHLEFGVIPLPESLSRDKLTALAPAAFLDELKENVGGSNEDLPQLVWEFVIEVACQRVVSSIASLSEDGYYESEEFFRPLKSLILGQLSVTLVWSVLDGSIFE